MAGTLDPDGRTHDDQAQDAAVEAAILALLAECTEVYPSHLVGELRRRAPGLPSTRVRPVLERLVGERRVAHLWHRYLLAERVDEVRRRWLAMIDHQAGRLARDRGDPHGIADVRAFLQGWDGWSGSDRMAPEAVGETVGETAE